MIPRFTKGQYLYAIKLYLAAMLAFSVAVKLGLSQPYWALVTCCVLSNPLRAAVRSKAVYRVCGTIFAGSITLVLASWFASTPILLVATTGIATTGLVFGACLDRTPRAYAYQLGALTMMLVAIIGIGQPENMFTMVISRITEICLGVLSVSFIDSVIAPASMREALHARISRWTADIEDWLSTCLAEDNAHKETDHARLKTVADITEFSLWIEQLAYDSDISPRERQLSVAIQQYLLQLVPLLTAISARMRHLPPEHRERLTPFIERVKDRVARKEMLAKEDMLLLPNDEDNSPWHHLLHQEIVNLIEKALSHWHAIDALYSATTENTTLPKAFAAQVNTAKALPLNADRSVAIRLAASVALVYTALCYFWWLTGWEQGPNVVLMGIVPIAFFGMTDDPGTNITGFSRFVFIAMFLGFVLCWGLLPLASAYGSFLVVMALYIIPLALWATRTPLVVLVLAISLSMINLQGQFTPFGFGFFLESMVGSLLGVYAAFIGASLFRQWGSEHALLRLIQQDKEEIRHLSQQASERKILRYTLRALDRIASQTARMGVDSSTGEEAYSTRLFKGLRLGVNVGRLAQFAQQPHYRAQLKPLLKHISVYLNHPTQQRIGAEDYPHDSTLQKALEHHLNQAWQQNNTALLMPLAGIRLVLFSHAEDWYPALAENVDGENPRENHHA